MDALIIVLAALVVPVLWGCGTHWLLERCWPRRNGRTGGETPAAAPPTDYLDYQI